jgi:hypothetical protein
MPSLPPTLPSLCPCSHASCLTWLVAMLPLVLGCLSFLPRHCLLFGGASTYPPLFVPLPLVVPLFFSGALTSHLPRLFVVSPLITLPPPVCLHLCFSLHCRLSFCPSHASCPAGCCVASHHAVASCLPMPLTLVALSPLVAPLLCLLSTLAGCCVASSHDGASHLPAPLPTMDYFPG